MPSSSTVHSQRTAPWRSRFWRSVPGAGKRGSGVCGAVGAAVATFAGAAFSATAGVPCCTGAAGCASFFAFVSSGFLPSARAGVAFALGSGAVFVVFFSAGFLVSLFLLMVLSFDAPGSSGWGRGGSQRRGCAPRFAFTSRR
jgi:hypothetical protein